MLVTLLGYSNISWSRSSGGGYTNGYRTRASGSQRDLKYHGKTFFQTWKAKAKEVQEKIMCPFRIAYLQLNEIVLNTGIDIRAVESDGLPSVHTGNKREARILKQPLGL